MANLGTDTNKNRCLERAEDFHKWCGNSSLVATATWTRTGESRSVGESGQPEQPEENESSTCEIQLIGTCSASTQYSNRTFVDEYGMKNLGTGEDKNACHARAQQFHQWCKNPSLVAKAIWTKTGETKTYTDDAAEQPSEPSTSNCVIEIEGACSFSPAYSNRRFLDEYGMKNAGTGKDKNACFARAQQFADWCQSSGTSVSAIWEATGESRRATK